MKESTFSRLLASSTEKKRKQAKLTTSSKKQIQTQCSTVMVRLQQSIIRFCLNLEYVCLEARGKGFVVSSDGDGFISGTGSKASIFKASLFLVVVLSCQTCYALWHSWYSATNEENVFNILFLVDMVGFIFMAILPFFGGMHCALGYFDSSLEATVAIQTRIHWLLDDRGTHRAVNLTLWCAGIYCVGDLLEFFPSFSTLWQRFSYVPFMMCNIAVFYGGTLIIILAMRIILVRLYDIESQVEDALELTEPRNYRTFRSSILYQQYEEPNPQHNAGDDDEDGDDEERNRIALVGTAQKNNNDDDDCDVAAPRSIGGNVNSERNSPNRRLFDPDQRALEWTQSYRMIRKDVHGVSDHFGVPMLVGLLIFLCETTSMIGMLWEEVGDTLGVQGTTALLLTFCTNAIMICSAFYSMAYLILECSHHIGPKLAVLAVRCHDQSPRYQVLASAFMHAPIKIHIGVFEIAPEYASAIGLWFLGLFLVVFGLKMPGGE